MPDTIQLRVYGGPQQGAQLELGPGTYVLGSSDAADLVFSDEDMLGAHAAIIISPTEAMVEAREGGYFIDGHDYPQGRIGWASGQLLQLGSTLLMWGTAGMQWPALNGMTAAAAKTDDTPEQTEPAAGDNSQERPAAGDASAEPQSDSGVKAVLRQARVVLPALLLVVLLALMIFGPAYFERSPLEQDTATVRQALGDRYKDVVVTPFEGAVKLTGSVPSQQQFTSLLQELPDIRCSTVLDVEVRDDEVMGLERTLRALGFNARVKHLDDDKLGVSAYMLDPFVEARIFNELDRYYQDRLQGRVLYRGDVDPELRKALTERGLDALQLDYTAGSILYQGHLSLLSESALKEAAEAVGSKLGIPLEVRSAEDAGLSMEALTLEKSSLSPAAAALGSALSAAGSSNGAGGQSGNGADGAQPQVFASGMHKSSEPLDVSDVVGLSVDPLRFVTLRNGQKYFEGGVLPSGYTLQSVELDKIIVTKGDESHEYRLK